MYEISEARIMFPLPICLGLDDDNACSTVVNKVSDLIEAYNAHHDELSGTLYSISPLGMRMKLSSSVAHFFHVALVSSRSACVPKPCARNS